MGDVNFREQRSEPNYNGTGNLGINTHFQIGAIDFQSLRWNNGQFTNIDNINDMWVGAIGATGNNIYIRDPLTGNHGLSSDDRLKSRTVPIPSTLPIITQLVPVTFQKHPDFVVPEGKEDSDLSGVTHYLESGVIAQDIEKIPELQHLVKPFTHPDLRIELKSVSYEQLIPYLIKGIQELSDLNKALTERVSKLES
jgi:hypothetical protein